MRGRLSPRGASATRGLALGGVLLCAVLGQAVTVAGVASGHAVTRAQSGVLPGFPAERGVVPVLRGAAAVKAHEALVNHAFAAADAREAAKLFGFSSPGTPIPDELRRVECVNVVEKILALETHDVCYNGGPVLHGPTVHLIFWQGPLESSGKPATPHVSSFPAHYKEIVEQYFAGLAADSGHTTNVFAVDPQYFEEKAGTKESGEYKIAFNATEDVIEDKEHVFPTNAASECSDKTSFSEGPCLLDSNLHEELKAVVESTQGKAKGWKETGPSDEEVYLLLTPPGVGSCFSKGSTDCAYTTYCAYHGDYGGNGETPGGQTIYANLPYLGPDEKGERNPCDDGVHPNEATDEGADALIDTASHELSEAITDPIGSQCAEGATQPSQCEPFSWLDLAGQEIADKCLPPETALEGFNGIYGLPLGPFTAGETQQEREVIHTDSFNQVVDGHDYWTQRQWSNEAGASEGACVQRAIGASFTVSANPVASVPVTFDAAASGGEGDPATYWIWSFGDGEQVATTSPTVSHTYANQGSYEVAVTAYDAYGSSEGHGQRVTVGPAPPPPPPPATITTTTTATTTATLTRTVARIARYSAATLARLLGLPGNRARLAGLGTITLGHGKCPPACGVSVRLYARISTTRRHRRVTRRVLVGSVRLTIANGRTQTIALRLNGRGRRLLRRRHRLQARLVLTVTGQEGGSWEVSRSYMLTSAGRSSRRHPPRRRAARR